MASKPLSATARTLLLSSLGLPGFSELLAEEPKDTEIDYRYTRYEEDALPASRVIEGDVGRYNIDTHQFRLTHKIDSKLTLTIDGMHESMSGSSPWYVIPDPVEGPLQVMSGATIRENRDQLDVSLSREEGPIRHTVGAGYSTEDDYTALFGSYSGERDSESGLTTWAWGLSISDDRISPTDAADFGRVAHEQRDSVSVSLGVTQVINRNAVIQTGLSATRQSGFLSDPYKEVWIARAVLFDQRPDDRQQYAWTTRFRQFFQRSEGALHADYRYFRDDWDITAHTLELAWQQPVGERWIIAPSIRYHSQHAAEFYAPGFAEMPDKPYWSSDYRLATFGALRYRLAANWQAQNWRVSISGDIYDSDESLALSGPETGTPGLVDFIRISFAVSKTF
jgi:hypothetical protein